MKLEKYLDYLVSWLQEQVKLTNTKGLIVGVSGGVDSAVVAALIKRSFPDNHLALFMPCESNPNDKILVEKLTNKLGLNLKVIDLNNSYQELKKSFQWSNVVDGSEKVALANCKSRLRMTTLYAWAKKVNYLVVGTSNFAEWYLGYFTKFGDGAADILPIVNLLKEEVKASAELLGIPEEIIAQPPTAGLWPYQTDEKELGITYCEIDNFLKGDVGSLSALNIAKITRIHNANIHKTKLAVFPEKIKKFK